MSYLKQPIEYTFDLNSKSQPKVLCVTHTDDEGVDVIKLMVTQSGNAVDLSQTIVTAVMVMRWTHELLNDNVSCEYDSETGSVMIPIDSATIPMRSGEMLVEVNIKSTVNDETLTLQFPLIVRVNGSILGNAKITPDSRGTIPELLQEVEQELERVQGFATEAQVFEILDNALSGSRNISPTLLVDNVTDQTHNPNGDLILYYIDSDDVRHNIFNFSPYLGTKDYNALQNRPVVTGSNVSTSVSRELEGVLNFESNSFLVSAYQAPDQQFNIELSPSVPICKTTSIPVYYDFNKISGVFANSGTFRVSANKILNRPSALNDIAQELYITHIATIADEADLIRYVTGKTANGTIVNYIQTAILSNLGAYRFDVIYQSEWQKIGAKVSSAVVNQNGTITFTLDDGSTFTTTGSSVIGSDGFSPTVSTTSEYLRTRVEITDVNGTQNIYINDGESVKSAVIDANGDLIITIKGKPTSGVRPTYPERVYNVGHVVGADGYSPTATVTQTQSGATVSITDKNGTTTANISNGVNGSDYILTAQDKSDIADLVLAELPTTQGVQYGNAGN